MCRSQNKIQVNDTIDHKRDGKLNIQNNPEGTLILMTDFFHEFTAER